MHALMDYPKTNPPHFYTWAKVWNITDTIDDALSPS